MFVQISNVTGTLIDAFAFLFYTRSMRCGVYIFDYDWTMLYVRPQGLDDLE